MVQAWVSLHLLRPPPRGFPEGDAGRRRELRGGHTHRGGGGALGFHPTPLRWRSLLTHSLLTGALQLSAKRDISRTARARRPCTLPRAPAGGLDGDDPAAASLGVSPKTLVDPFLAMFDDEELGSRYGSIMLRLIEEPE